MNSRFVCVISPELVRTPDGQSVVCNRWTMFTVTKTEHGDRSMSILKTRQGLEVIAPTGSIAGYPQYVTITERHGSLQEYEVFTVLSEGNPRAGCLQARSSREEIVDLPFEILEVAACNPAGVLLAVG